MKKFCIYTGRVGKESPISCEGVSNTIMIATYFNPDRADQLENIVKNTKLIVDGVNYGMIGEEKRYGNIEMSYFPIYSEDDIPKDLPPPSNSDMQFKAILILSNVSFESSIIEVNFEKNNNGDIELIPYSVEWDVISQKGGKIIKACLASGEST